MKFGGFCAVMTCLYVGVFLMSTVAAQVAPTTCTVSFTFYDSADCSGTPYCTDLNGTVTSGECVVDEEEATSAIYDCEAKVIHQYDTPNCTGTPADVGEQCFPSGQLSTRYRFAECGSAAALTSWLSSLLSIFFVLW